MNNMVSIKINPTNSKPKEVIDFLNPDYLYIPIREDYEIKVKTKKTVYKGEALMQSDKRYIYSPISGSIVGKTTSMKCGNEDIECIVIENDFKEKQKKRTGVVKYINEYSKVEFLGLIEKYNACSRPINIKGKTLLINGIDADPYEHTFSFLINTYSSKILETIDALATILGVENTLLAINNNDTENVMNLTNNVGTYPNITLKLVPDIYPIGFKDILIKNILTKKMITNGYTYLTVQDVYNIYMVLKRKKAVLEKLVTLAGDAIDEPKVINVKIGTSMAELIKNCCTITKSNYYVVVNGLISGNTLTTLNSVITEDTRSIFLNTKDNSSEKKCINCGLCNRKCPVGLNPKYLKEHKKADRSKCIGCGLCTYICPSKINFKEYLGGSDEK